MPSLPSTVSWAAQKVRDLPEIGADWFAARELGVTGRARFAVEAVKAMAGDKREIPYFGHRLHYDHRLQPMLLPIHMSDVRTLESIVGLEDATVLDVGANIGQFGATVMWRFPRTTVWSFEPNPQIYQLLESNAAQSERWTTVPWGLAAEDADVPFWFVEGKSGQGSIYRDNATTGLREQQTVELLVSLRELTSERMRSLGVPGTVDLLKVDVEGAEREVLRGLSHLRWRYLAIELSVERSGRMTADAATELISDIWGTRPSLMWQSKDPGAAAQDAIFALA
jgi:FkbM family methyltransferase